MHDKFTLTIRTPEKDILNQEVESLNFSSEGGDMEIFADHASVTATISFSSVCIKTSDKEENYMVRQGVFSFDNQHNEATLLALHCEHKTEISKQSVEEYLKFIEEKIREGKDMSDYQIQYLEGEKLALEEQMQELA